jgi:hydrogenase expression/formation protein HypD
MKYIDEFRDREIVRATVAEIRRISKTPLRLMEVCGGHTMAIQRFGIPYLLPSHIQLLSGPGCPVCVSDRRFIDQAIALSRRKDTIICTFGDLIRVPGSSSSLDREKARGANIRIIYSPLEALEVARQKPDFKVVMLGIGFETTTPGSAVAILRARDEGLSNFFLHSSHKIMPPAMGALIDEGVKIDGYIAPGHVSTITGSGMYEPLVKKYGVACVISGFEPVDILQSILMLINQCEQKKPSVEIQYSRVVKPEGNLRAQAVMDEVFELRDDWWRGFGILPMSGLALKANFRQFDALEHIPIEVEATREDKGCICGAILKGVNTPADCKLFAKVCTPSDPVGSCMVSHEGACHAHYKYQLIRQV